MSRESWAHARSGRPKISLLFGFRSGCTKTLNPVSDSILYRKSWKVIDLLSRRSQSNVVACLRLLLGTQALVSDRRDSFAYRIYSFGYMWLPGTG